MKNALVAAAFLALSGGCTSYLFEGYPGTAGAPVPRLKYRVTDVALRYGGDYVRLNSVGGEGMSGAEFARIRPDVFGTGDDCVPITVRMRVREGTTSAMDGGPFIFAALTLTIVPAWMEWNASHEVRISLAGDETMSSVGSVCFVDSMRMSVYTPSALIFRRSPPAECEVHEKGTAFVMNALFDDEEAVKHSRSALYRTLTEEVVRILGKMEEERRK